MDDRQIFGYSRVSSDEQAQHGISISAQRDILNAYAAMHQTTVQIYEDAGFSGKNTRRPALQRMLADVAAGSCSTVVVWKLDRLSRNLRDTLHIIEDVLLPAGVSLVSVTESIDTSTPSGRMMLNLLASFAQLEREQDSDRVVMAHKHLARDCRYLGGHVPLGYTVDADHHFQLDPVTAPVVRRAFEMYLARSGYTPILDYLNSQPIPAGTRTRPFSKQDLLFMLKNEIYAGTYVRRMGTDRRSRISSPEVIRVPGGVPAILTPEEWTAVCAIRDANRVSASRHRSGHVYPLSGLVYCAVCGSLMKVNYGGKTRSGDPERYYECGRHKCIPSPRLEATEAAVFTALHFYSRNEELLRKACAVANDYAAGTDQDHRAEIAALERDLIGENKKAARITAFIAEHGAEAPSTLMDELRSIEVRQDRIRSKIASISKPVSRYDADRALKAVRAADDIEKQPPEQQKLLVQAAVFRVLVSKDDFQIILLWPKCGGDDPPQYVSHKIRRN